MSEPFVPGSPVKRHVPLMLRLALPVSGAFRQGGWAFVVFGSVFCAIFLPLIENPLRSYDAQMDGVVRAVERTSSTQNDRRIFAVEVQYPPATEAEATPSSPTSRLTTSYTADPPEVGALVTVEYDSSDPDSARMRGARSSHFSSWVLFVLMFPAIGLVFALAQTGDALRTLGLLSRGYLTRARFADKRAGNLSVNDVPQSRMRFTFVDHHGVEVPFEVKTFKPELLEDDREEPALYDPRQSRFATTIDHLPGKLEVRDDRVIAHASLGKLLILPFLGVAGLVTVIAVAVLLT